ncbi:MAG TPA: site-2 protease family protein [Pirellulaceae bacterium]|nr:site-2 protease family protein [Pirellulaceae bacterium]
MKWKLGTLAGIGVYLHWSFWLLPAWILMSAGGGLAGAVGLVLFVFAIFGCVVLHELGHALMARHYGIGTRDITLYPIGGVASLERMPRRPSQELAIALAGPAVNVVIAGVLFGILLVAGIGTQGLVFNVAGGSILLNLLAVNVALVVFNMLPAFPMDGGRVLRAFLAMRVPYLRATEIAVRVGQGVAIVLAVIGMRTGGTMLFIALFIFLAARAELAMARRQELSGASSVIDAVAWHHKPTAAAPASDNEIVWLDTNDKDQTGTVQIIRASDGRGV